MLEARILVSNAYEDMDRYFCIKFLYSSICDSLSITYHYILPFDSEHASFYPLS